jgi:AbrB family looped-hinge helix DNA binding protein
MVRMQIKRKIGPKWQIIIPKIVREFLGLKSGDEVILEVRDEEVLIRRWVNPTNFVDDFCSLIDKKLKRKLTWKSFWREKLKRELSYIDSNFHIPVIYDENAAIEARRAGKPHHVY